MTNDLFSDCTYIGVNKSPRSDNIPKFYKTAFIDFDLGVNVKTTITNIIRVLVHLKTVKIVTRNVVIEYDGNLILNFLLILYLLNKKIFIDCHNCAVEKEEGKRLRYIVNIIYLSIAKVLFRCKLIVHNNAVKKHYPLESFVVYTPFPDLSEFKTNVRNNDVIFSCSLNSDEPVDRIIQTCIQLEEKGFKSKITGNFKKLPYKMQINGARFFTGYISKPSYFEILAHSKVMVCLTNRENTLLYSPREGISLGLKVIISSNSVNREFFGSKGIFISLEDDMCELIENAIQ